MKLTITKEEAIKCIRANLSLASTIEVEITGISVPGGFGDYLTDPVPLSPEIVKILNLIDGIVLSDKLMAIKEYRNFGGRNADGQSYIGLKDAKDVIDHWGQARQVIRSLNSLVIRDNGIGNFVKI